MVFIFRKVIMVWLVVFGSPLRLERTPLPQLYNGHSRYINDKYFLISKKYRGAKYQK